MAVVKCWMALWNWLLLWKQSKPSLKAFSAASAAAAATVTCNKWEEHIEELSEHEFTINKYHHDKQRQNVIKEAQSRYDTAMEEIINVSSITFN